MRDIARIELMLNRLRSVWEANPDLRLGQLIENAASEWDRVDLFYIEDDALSHGLLMLANRLKDASHAIE